MNSQANLHRTAAFSKYSAIEEQMRHEKMLKLAMDVGEVYPPSQAGGVTATVQPASAQPTTIQSTTVQTTTVQTANVQTTTTQTTTVQTTTVQTTNAQPSTGTTTGVRTTDYFDFVVSPLPREVGNDDHEHDFLHRAAADCQTSIANFLNDTRLHDVFIKETNNNNVTVLPPVSTITGVLSHHNQRIHSENDHGQVVPMDQSGYWASDDAKEQTRGILEDLNKWGNWQPAGVEHHSGDTGMLDHLRDSPGLGDALQQVQQQQQQHQQHQQQRLGDLEDRRNTDGAIYTLTVLNSEANSMDGLECCKSPGGSVIVGSGPDSWRPSSHLDLDAILNMESSVSIGADASGGDTSASQDANGLVAGGPGQFDEHSSFVQVHIKAEMGDNNNDWKLSDRNSLQDSSESSAESLLRNALQGKLYPGTARILTTSDVQAAALHVKDEQMQPDELLLSQLDVEGAYPGGYEKLKSITNEVVESYCNLEPAVCSVQPGTTVMYTLDPASGSLGTITLPADLAQVGTVTVVTTAPQQPQPQEALLQDTRHSEQQAQSATVQQTSTTQLQIATSGSGGRAPGSKPAKKYVRRSKANGGAGGNAGANSAGSGANSSSSGAGSPGGGGGGGSVTTQRKERSLHYCSICSKGFKDKYSVNVHIRTHTGEKPFSCSLCGKSFRQKAHLAKHYQTHVTQKPSSVAAQAAQAAAAAQAQANAQSNGGTPPSPGNTVEQVVQAVAAADSQIAS